MSLADKISTLQEFGIVSSLEFMTSLLRSANGDVTRAASNYFETPSLQKKASEELQK